MIDGNAPSNDRIGCCICPTSWRKDVITPNVIAPVRSPYQIGNKYDQVNKIVPRLSNILIYFATADIAGMKSFFRDICPSTRIYPC